MEPGTKIAIISKSAEGVAPAAPAQKKSEKVASKPSPPAEAVAKVEATPAAQKPKAPSPPPPKRTATEPILPPKERERRVSLFICCLHPNGVLRISDVEKMMLAS